MKFALAPLLFLFVACSGKSARLVFPDDSPPLNTFFSMEVLVDADWVENIHFDADMPAHGHGLIVKPVVSPLESGRWRIDGMKFHMPGEWEVYIDMIAGARSERETITVVVEPW